MKKIKKNRIALLILFFLMFFLFGFSSNNDSLYMYQWGLKNAGNGHLNKALALNNYNFMNFDWNVANLSFPSHKQNVNDFYQDSLTYIEGVQNVDIGFEDAYSLYSNIQNKSEVIVAIIDGGIDINHTELSGSIWTNRGEIPGDGIDNDGNGYIDDVHGYNFFNHDSNVLNTSITDVHGTHVAGSIVAAHSNVGIKGIAYTDEHNVKIMPIKILGESHIGNVKYIAEAIKYAHLNGAKICNISLGSMTIDDELDRVIRTYHDMLFVVAAGNGENFVGYELDELPIYPAAYNYPNVITVGNLSLDGSRYISSNYGKSVDIFAPGTFILSLGPNNTYGFMTGTSMSSPYVTAVASMVMSAFNKSAFDVKKIINNSAVIDGKLVGLCVSNGRLNAFNALLLASQYS